MAKTMMDLSPISFVAPSAVAAAAAHPAIPDRKRSGTVGGARGRLTSDRHQKEAMEVEKEQIKQ